LKKHAIFIPEVEKLLEAAKKLRGGNGQPSINSAVFSLVKASLNLANKALDTSVGAQTLYKDRSYAVEI